MLALLAAGDGQDAGDEARQGDGSFLCFYISDMKHYAE